MCTIAQRCGPEGRRRRNDPRAAEAGEDGAETREEIRRAVSHRARFSTRAEGWMPGLCFPQCAVSMGRAALAADMARALKSGSEPLAGGSRARKVVGMTRRPLRSSIATWLLTGVLLGAAAPAESIDLRFSGAQVNGTGDVTGLNGAYGVTVSPDG